jgi:hypothetical protein
LSSGGPKYRQEPIVNANVTPRRFLAFANENVFSPIIVGEVEKDEEGQEGHQEVVAV